MKEKRDTGGQAFPKSVSGMGGNEGMTLRDYFAGQALLRIASFDIPGGISKRCYMIADAMLKEREFGKEK